MGACRRGRDHRHAGAGLAVDVPGAAGGAAAVPAPSDREIDRLLPRLAALVTVCIPPLCVLLDRAPPNLAFNLLAVAAGISANVLGAWTLSFLGRSFSVMPEARRLVTTGPYSIVRHPLYLFELLGVIGILLQVRSLAGVALLAHRRAAGCARPLGRSGPRSRHSGICGLPPPSPVPDPAQSAQLFRAAARRPDRRAAVRPSS